MRIKIELEKRSVRLRGTIEGVRLQDYSRMQTLSPEDVDVLKAQLRSVLNATIDRLIFKIDAPDGQLDR
jgi:predicted DNA-binding ribbon-helix-helix protein